MEPDVVHRKVSIRPIHLLQNAHQLLGEQYWLFVGITIVAMMIGSAVPMAIMMGPMMCGIHLCLLTRHQGKRVEFGLLFKGFDYFVESLIAVLIMVGVSMVVTIPSAIVFVVVFFNMMAGTKGDPPVALFGVMFLMYVVMIVLIVLITLPFLFVFPLMVERGLKAVPALKVSCRGVMANLMGIVWMVLVYNFLSMIAGCLCYFPALMLMPLIFGAIFLAYRDIFPAGQGYVVGQSAAQTFKT